MPSAGGSAPDIMTRLLDLELQKRLDQPVVADNKPGAGGALGSDQVAKAPANGYTLLMASPALTISPALYASLPYKPEQIAPVDLLGRVPNVLLVNLKSGMNSVPDLLARARREPGKMNYASNGNAASLHLSAELLKSTTGTFITHIPYRGAAAAVTGLISGEVDMMFENLPLVMGQIQCGAVKALAVTTLRRSKTLPDVPTVVELGMPEFDVSAWYGVAAPAGKPPAVVSALEQALQKIMREPEVVGTMESRGAEIGFFASHGHGHVHGGECEKMETRRQFCKNYPGLKE